MFTAHYVCYWTGMQNIISKRCRLGTILFLILFKQMTKMGSHVDKTTTIQTYSAATLIVSRNKYLYISFIQ